MTDPNKESAALLAFLYACPIGLAEMTEDGDICMINPMAMQLLIPLAKTPSMNFFNIMEAYAPELRNAVQAFQPCQGSICEDHRILIQPERAGEEQTTVFACTLVKLSPDRLIITLSDISKQVKQERKLKEAETWFSSLMEGAQDFGVASLDAEGRIESVNSSVARQTGYQQEELLGRTLDVFSASNVVTDSLSAEQQMNLASREGWYLHETWQEHKDGTAYWCQRLMAVRSEEQQALDRIASGYTVVFREGEQRSVDVHRLKQMLTRDHLTGAYNRMYFFDVAEKECARSKRYKQPLSLIAIDVDSFKQVNDLHGHAIGDAVLTTFAERCMSLLRPSDTMARIGGEEFVILLPSTTLSGATQLAERLRVAIAGTAICTHDQSLEITGSFGCAEIQSSSCALAELMSSADQALYQAKRTGRNRVVSYGVNEDEAFS